ncbi:MAG: stabilization protein [Siphoviridae sp. ctdEk19]|nr:MAG: stabilization protein [Siphoviridae sp. ctdEk19]
MRQALERPAKLGASLPYTLPAPVGGWNARDAVAGMKPTDALFLDNWIPTTAGCELVEGSTEFASVTAGQVIYTLVPYKSPAGTTKLFAASAAGLYDVTAGGAVGSVAVSATNGKWQYAAITTSGGSFLSLVNGVDTPKKYNGSAWSAQSLTGVTSSELVNVALAKRRLWFCRVSSLSVYYLAVDSIEGALTAFDLGPVFRRGGYVMACGSWSLDAGEGLDDHFVAVSSEGEVAVYKGTDPSSASTWALVGVFYVGAPIGRRCLISLGGDLLLLTETGVFPLSKALQTATLTLQSAVSDKIVNAWQAYNDEWGSLYGWSGIVVPKHSLLVLNAPTQTESYSVQFAMNTVTKAWCRLLGKSAHCSTVYEGEAYHALANKVYKTFDGFETSSASVTGSAKQAYTGLGSRGRSKHLKLLRPIFSSTGTVTASMGVDTDFNLAAVGGSSTVSYTQALAQWDTSSWDDAYWSGGQMTVKSWRSANHQPGHTLAVRLRLTARRLKVVWTATDLIFEKGGLL